MKQIHVAVLMGGPSAEREVSLRSGQMAAQALRNAGLAVTEVPVHGEEFDLPGDCDVAFLALHGAFGEDGQVQSLLESRGVAYTGSGPAASAAAMDKAVAKSRFAAAGILTPGGSVLERDLTPAADLRLPVVVKPVQQGSSFGVSIARTKEEFHEACLKAWCYDARLLIEEYIHGREFTVGVLGTRPLPVVEIRVSNQHEFFDHTVKYTPGLAEELVPAPLDALTAARIQDLAWRAHECLGCRDMSRTDVMMSAAGDLYVLETNTIPGLTATSLLPKAAAAAGINMEQLCSRLVEMAYARRLEAVPA